MLKYFKQDKIYFFDHLHLFKVEL